MHKIPCSFDLYVSRLSGEKSVVVNGKKHTFIMKGVCGYDLWDDENLNIFILLNDNVLKFYFGRFLIKNAFITEKICKFAISISI